MSGQQGQWNNSDYVSVAERLQEFLDKYPEGSLQFEVVEYRTFPEPVGAVVIGKATAFRVPGDPSPGVGWAQESVPGKTNFTRHSEIQNLETSAWGRAMAALGIATKKGIASREEVRRARAMDRAPVSREQEQQEMREAYAETAPVTRVTPSRVSPDDPTNDPYQTSPSPVGPAATKGQVQVLSIRLKEAGHRTPEERHAYIQGKFPDVVWVEGVPSLTKRQVSELIDSLPPSEKV